MNIRRFLISSRAIITIIVSCILVLVSGCNRDVFIDKGDVLENKQFKIEGDGGEIEFFIPTKELQHIGLDIIDEERKYCKYYNQQGEEVFLDSPASEVAGIVLETNFLMLKIAKSGGKISVRSAYNTYKQDFDWTIRLEYNYGVVFVNIIILPGKPLRLVDVRYNSELKVTEQAEVRSRRTGFKNDGPIHQTFEVMPYLQEAALFFVNPASKSSWIKSEKLTMKVPVYESGTWELGERANFYPGNVNTYYRPDQLLKVDVDIPEYSNVDIFTDVTYSKAEVSGTMTFQNEVLNRYITADFDATSYYPVDYRIRVEKK